MTVFSEPPLETGLETGLLKHRPKKHVWKVTRVGPSQRDSPEAFGARRCFAEILSLWFGANFHRVEGL